ncbi:MAG: recombinase family protein [Peptococcaceae bacterium]|nr:recombinase family protein [Peptococcaceae bacterium]
MALTYAVAYARFSSDNQREESIDAQLRAIREYCGQKSYVLVDTYVDEAESAMTDDRPSFLRMIKDAERANWTVILVHKLDRFSRNRYDSAIYKRKLKECGVHIESVLEHLDDSPESVILESVLEGMAEYYSLNLGREVKKGHHENALKCMHNGGPPPFGFAVAPDGAYIINEHEAEAIRKLFTMVTHGYTLQQISDELAKEGYYRRNGKPFSLTSLSRMLHNEKYIGTYIFNQRREIKRNGKRIQIPNPQEEIIKIEGGMPVIVSREQYNEVQRIMKRRTKMSDKVSRRAKEIYLLQGLLVCGNCGRSMVGIRRTDYRYNKIRTVYECNGRRKSDTNCKMRPIDRDYVENIVIDYVEQNLLSEEAIEKVKIAVTEALDEMKSHIPDNMDALLKELKDTKAAQSKLIDAIMNGIDIPAIKEKIAELEDKKNTLAVRIEHLEAQQQAVSVARGFSMDEYLSEYRNIRLQPRPRQKEILNKFVNRVIIYDNDTDGDKMELELKVPESTVMLPSGYTVTSDSPRVG